MGAAAGSEAGAQAIARTWLPLLALLLALPGRAHALSGQVLDAVTGRPIAGAFVTVDGALARSDEQGAFESRSEGALLRVRASGYRRAEVAARELTGEGAAIRLEPFVPKALYLSFYGIGTSALRTSALRLIEETELNALVIDVKGDRGMVSYRSASPLASRVRAQDTITIPDAKAQLAALKQAEIYSIARIVVFKDDRLARARPELAVKGPAGAPWRDREGLAWADPFQREVREYNVELAVEAARHGFDEIQFDYVRFPDAKGLVFAGPNTAEARVRAIQEFLVEAKQRLAPYNVFLSADVFGYVCWNRDDTGIGQVLERLAPELDYVSPMLYPSSFQFGIPGYRNAVQHPYEIVYLTLSRAKQRTGLPGARFRPWLQAFPDYAFDRRRFGAAEIRAQIRAAEAAGCNGWMLWNPSNTYSRDGLEPSAR
jgi:hypothetical protein